MKTLRSAAWLLACLLACAPLLRADRPPRYEERREHDPYGIGKFYMGREIAQVMGHQGADWLERPQREKEEKTSKLLKVLDFKPGQVVADIGAGSGYLTFRVAPRVGPKGKVYAVDIQKEMLDIIRRRMKNGKVTNVQPVLGTTKDPRLPANSVDVILLVDVYHEFDWPYEMTQALIKTLKPGGRMVFVEFKGEKDKNIPILEVHKMTEAQVLKEMKVHPLRHVKTVKDLPWQHVIIFQKVATIPEDGPGGTGGRPGKPR